jgi:hypothetical protein
MKTRTRIILEWIAWIVVLFLFVATPSITALWPAIDGPWFAIVPGSLFVLLVMASREPGRNQGMKILKGIATVVVVVVLFRVLDTRGWFVLTVISCMVAFARWTWRKKPDTPGGKRCPMCGARCRIPGRCLACGEILSAVKPAAPNPDGPSESN